MTQPYDAILIVAFGGPEGMTEVLPFLENVTRGRNIPRERLEQVAHHYEHFHGVSPINQQMRDLINALHVEFAANGPHLPVYWGNRNWHPMLAETLAAMAADGVTRAIAFVAAAYSSYSSCRQYREDIEKARAAVTEAGLVAPQVDKIRVFYNHPLFIEAASDGVSAALATLPAASRANAHLVFTAHSIPSAMASNSRYAAQLAETSRLVAQRVGCDDWKLVYQSRSGPPMQPWLEPDICDYLREIHTSGKLAASGTPGAMRPVVIAPIGFLSDHIEVLWDLDEEARQLCAELSIPMVRAATVGTHPRFVQMIRQLLVERIDHAETRPAAGNEPASHDVCPVDCCKPAPSMSRPAGPPHGTAQRAQA